MNQKTYTGIVIHGDGYGRTIGYPTANIEVTKPLSGVFAGTVAFDGKTYQAALFASERRPILEAHLLDFDGDLYGKHIAIEMLEKVREATVFSDDDALRAAIFNDIVSLREFFSNR